MKILTDEELRLLPKTAIPFNNGGGVITNREILASICKELLEYREKERLVTKNDGETE